MKPSIRARREAIAGPVRVVTSILVATGPFGCGGNDPRPAVNAQQTPPVGQWVPRPGPTVATVFGPAAPGWPFPPATSAASPSSAPDTTAQPIGSAQAAANPAAPGSGGHRTFVAIWPPAGRENMKCDGDVPTLPEPEVWKLPRRQLTADQMRRQNEVDRHLARRYCEQRYRIVATTQDGHGQILDWLDPASVPGSDKTPPPSMTPPPPPPPPPPAWAVTSPAPASLPPPAILATLPIPETPIGYPWPAGLVRIPRLGFKQYIFEDTTWSSLEEMFRNTKEVVSIPPIADTIRCDNMKITPASIRAGGPPASCDPTGSMSRRYPSPGYSLCLRASWLYSAPSAKDLRECLGRIDGGPAIACDLGPVTDCVVRTHKVASPSQAAADTCRFIHDKVCAANARFDMAACAEGLNPLRDGALQAVADCVTMDPTFDKSDCQAAYSACLYRIVVRS